MKKFKTESKRVLDMMINSIYTNKEIFLREILSNSSDAIDKLYYKSLTEGISGNSREDFAINIGVDKEKRTLTISDNGIGMTKDELDENLGVIAKSGSFDFKKDLEKNEDVSIIGQFGVGFYSSFMVSDFVEVISKAFGEDKAYKWSSKGTDGYEITEDSRDEVGTTIVLHLKDDLEEEDYSQYLEEYTLRDLVKKYSNYVKVPIKMETTKYDYDEESKKSIESKEVTTLNKIVPIWKKSKSDVTKEEYNDFYKEIAMDMEEPLRVIHTSVEGAVDYKAILYIPSALPYNYYTKNYEKGLKLYTNGVMIMDKCADLLPDYFGFVKGIVDSELTLNVSRETVQQNRQLKAIAKNLEKKIKTELLAMLKNNREDYTKFFGNFGSQIKFGVYDQWGVNKDALKDLLVYYSIKEDKMISLEEYVKNMGVDQKFIYYATGKTNDGIKVLPQTEKVIDAGYDVLCMTDDIDEFAIKVLQNHQDKEFRSVAGEDLGLTDIEVADEDKEVMDYLKEVLGDKVEKVKPSTLLKGHPVCLTSLGEVSIEMEKVLNNMPGVPQGGVKAQKILEINANHSIYEKIKEFFVSDKEKLGKLINVLYSQALLIEGLSIDNPTELANTICDLI